MMDNFDGSTFFKNRRTSKRCCNNFATCPASRITVRPHQQPDSTWRRPADRATSWALWLLMFDKQIVHWFSDRDGVSSF